MKKHQEEYFKKMYMKPTAKWAVVSAFGVYVGIACILALGRSGTPLERLTKVGADLWRAIHPMPWYAQSLFVIMLLMFPFALHNNLWKGAEAEDVWRRTNAWNVPMKPLSFPLSNGFAYFFCQTEDCVGHLATTEVFSRAGDKLKDTTREELRRRLEGHDRCFCNVCGVEHKDAEHVAVNPLNLKEIVSGL